MVNTFPVPKALVFHLLPYLQFAGIVTDKIRINILRRN